jgi:hypothetical protein
LVFTQIAKVKAQTHVKNENLQILPKLWVSSGQRQARRWHREGWISQCNVLFDVLSKWCVFNPERDKYGRKDAGFLHTTNEK